MSSKFSPKFTIATAYPMMYCSSDLKYIESEMLHVISSDTKSSPGKSSDPSDSVFFEVIETPTDCYRWLKNSEVQRLQTISQLEHLWQNDPEDASQKGYQRP